MEFSLNLNHDGRKWMLTKKPNIFTYTRYTTGPTGCMDTFAKGLSSEFTSPPDGWRITTITSLEQIDKYGNLKSNPLASEVDHRIK